jgi:hypothetical protein
MYRLQSHGSRVDSGRQDFVLPADINYLSSGGGGGIRTRDTVSRIHTFQACAFSLSATPPFCAPDASSAHITAPSYRASRRRPAARAIAPSVASAESLKSGGEGFAGDPDKRPPLHTIAAYAKRPEANGEMVMTRTRIAASPRPGELRAHDDCA